MRAVKSSLSVFNRVASKQASALDSELIKKYGEKNSDSPAASVANVLSAATSLAGVGGVDLSVFLPADQFSATAISTVVETAKTRALNWANEHSKEKTALQVRIAKFMSNSEDSAAFRPTNDIPVLQAQLAGLTLGQYYCQAAAHYGHKILDKSCSDLDRIFSTVTKMGESWKGLPGQLDNLLIETKTTRLKEKLKQRARFLEKK